MRERHGHAGRGAGRRARRRARDEVFEEGPRCEQRFTPGGAASVSGHAPLRARAELPGLSRPPGLRMLRQRREELVQGL